MEPKSQPPEHFSHGEEYASYRPVARLTLEESVDRVDHVIRYCRANKIGGLLIDMTNISGFPPPTLAERYWFIQKWAKIAAGKVVIAMVAPPEMILPDKIGVTIAHNRGLTGNVFTDESEAVEWLRAACRS